MFKRSVIRMQATGKSSSVISFRPEYKARNIQTLVSVIKVHHALLISQTIMKDERRCSFNLRRAFDARLVFRLGTSNTTGR